MVSQALLLVTSLVISTLAIPAPAKIQSRVAGGNLAEPGEFPFVVAPQLNGDAWCAGSLLNAYTVLTAAHCSINNPATNLTIRAGSVNWRSGGVVSNVSEIKIHPSYRAVVGTYDVAIWHLETPIQPSDTINYATYVAQGYTPSPGLNATVAGWGDTTPNPIVTGSEVLRWVNVPVVSPQGCAIYGVVSSARICAGGEDGKGSCPRDSGGPIWNTETGEIIGTVSSGGGCGKNGTPIVYTNLGSMSDWVKQNAWYE